MAKVNTLLLERFCGVGSKHIKCSLLGNLKAIDKLERDILHFDKSFPAIHA